MFDDDSKNICSYIYKIKCTHVGVGSMQRVFGSDTMHTWELGFVEACIGFTLQIIQYIGQIDANFIGGVQRVEEILHNFPSYNSLHPVRHIRFPKIWEILKAGIELSKKNPLDSTGHLKMRECYKLASILLQLYFAASDPSLFPVETTWSKSQGFSEPFFSVRQVVVNTLHAVLQVHWYLHVQELSESQLLTMQMLISNAQAHMLCLDVVRKRIVHKAITPSHAYKEKAVHEMGLLA